MSGEIDYDRIERDIEQSRERYLASEARLVTSCKHAPALLARCRELEARCEKLAELVEDAYGEGRTDGVMDYLHLGPKPWRTSATRHTLAEIMEDSTDD